MTGINRQSAAPWNATHTPGTSYPMASLIVQNGTQPVTYELVGDIVMIGRASLNDIVIDNPVVSAQHAMLLKVGDTYWLKDLNSTNGTHINGLLFTYGELKDGDTIRFASIIAIFWNAAANVGQRARLERSGRVPQQDENPPPPKGIQRKWNLMTQAKKKSVELTTSVCSIK